MGEAAARVQEPYSGATQRNLSRRAMHGTGANRATLLSQSGPSAASVRGKLLYE